MDADDVTAREVILFSPILEKLFNFIGVECKLHIWAYIHVLSIERASLSQARRARERASLSIIVN